MVGQLIGKMVCDDDGSFAKEAETIIQNVAMVAVEGVLHSTVHALFGSHRFWIPLAASDTVHRRYYDVRAPELTSTF